MISERHVKKFCRDDLSLIKNYDLAIADSKHIWHCHHINELTFTREELIKMNMYYDRPASELIFLTKSEHSIIHRTICAGRKEWNTKISNSQKGKTSCWKGKILPIETKQKIAKSHIGMKATEETKSKIRMSKLGKKRKPFSEETKRKMREARRRYLERREQ